MRLSVSQTFGLRQHELKYAFFNKSQVEILDRWIIVQRTKSTAWRKKVSLLLQEFAYEMPFFDESHGVV